MLSHHWIESSDCIRNIYPQMLGVIGLCPLNVIGKAITLCLVIRVFAYTNSRRLILFVNFEAGAWAMAFFFRVGVLSEVCVMRGRPYRISF